MIWSHRVFDHVIAFASRRARDSDGKAFPQEGSFPRLPLASVLNPHLGLGERLNARPE
jgi:hypothetical protein